MHGSVIVCKRLELELNSRLLRDEFIGSGADRLLHEPVLPDCFVIFRWNDPARPTHIGGPEQDREIEERLFEVEAHCTIIDDFDPLGLLAEHFARSAAIVLIAPFDIFGRNRGPIVEFDPRPQSKGRALGVFGKLEPVGECRMVVADLAEVFDQGVMQRHQEIIAARRAVMLLRIEPARGDIAVPRQYHLTLGSNRFRRVGLAHKRGRQRRRRCGGGAEHRTPGRHHRRHIPLLCHVRIDPSLVSRFLGLPGTVGSRRAPGACMRVRRGDTPPGGIHKDVNNSPQRCRVKRPKSAPDDKARVPAPSLNRPVSFLSPNLPPG